MEDIVKKELDTLLSLLGIDAEYDLNIEEQEGISNINISFSGDNLGYLIGNRGKHLESLQYIFSMMLRNLFKEEVNYRVLLDVCGYKEEKNKKIEKIALQKADDARILGEAVELEPMNPSDRRTVHITLQVFDDIRTESIGEGGDRRVRVIPVSDKDILTEEVTNPEEGEEGEE